MSRPTSTVEPPNLAIREGSVDSLCEKMDKVVVADESDNGPVERQLKELNKEISAALDEAVNRGKELAPYTDMMQLNFSEAQKQLHAHKLRVASQVEACYQRQLENLKTKMKECVQDVMVARTVGINYESRLANLQAQLTQMKDEKAASGKPTDDHLVERLHQLQDEFSSLTRKKPEMRVEKKTLRAVLPTVILEDLQPLMGSVDVHVEVPIHQLSDPSPPVLEQESSVQSSKDQPEPVGSLTFYSRKFQKNDRSANTKAGSRVEKENLPATTKKERKRNAKRGKLPEKASQKVKITVRGNKHHVFNEQPLVSETVPFSEEDKTGVEEIISKRRELAQSTNGANGSRSDQWVSITTRPGFLPIKHCTGVSDFAPCVDNKVWVIYYKEKALELLNERGDTIQKLDISCKSKRVIAFEGKDAIVVHGAPKSLKMYTEEQQSFSLFKNFLYQQIASTTSGIAVAYQSIIEWVPFEGDLNWIPVCSSRHSYFISLSIFTYNGKPMICAADTVKNKIHFFQQKTQEEAFKAFSPFVVPRKENFLSRKKVIQRGEKESKVTYFQPVSISAHHSGFLAVLDRASHDVYILDVRKVIESKLIGMQCVVSIIPGHNLCSGEPRNIAFSVTESEEEEDEEENLKMWVKDSSNDLYSTSLAFLNW